MRSGGTVRLAELLDSAIAKARGIVAEKNPEMPAADLDRIADQATDFYENCPVLTADTDPRRTNRRTVSAPAADTLRHGLGLLGIAAPDRL